MNTPALRWVAFAVIGLIVALAVAFLATRMVSERIGISAEPVTAGANLTVHRGHRDKGGQDVTATVPAASSSPPPDSQPPSSDDYSQSGSTPGRSDESSHRGGTGEGHGEGGDD